MDGGRGNGGLTGRDADLVQSANRIAGTKKSRHRSFHSRVDDDFALPVDARAHRRSETALGFETQRGVQAVEFGRGTIISDRATASRQADTVGIADYRDAALSCARLVGAI